MKIAASRLVKGMNQDTLGKHQPPDTYYAALNAVIETSFGEVSGLSREFGFQNWVKNLPPDKTIIGGVLTDENTLVLFLFDGSDTRPEHEIGIYDPSTKEYKTYLRGPCLNFNVSYPISAFYKRRGCSRLVYFTDNYNNYRVVDLDHPEYYSLLVSDYIADCNRLQFSPDQQPAEFIRVFTGNKGSSLDVGNYSIAVRYQNWDNSYTPFFIHTHYIPLVPVVTSPASQYQGGIPDEDSPLYKGKSPQSIEVRLEGVDLNMKAVQLAVIKRSNRSGSVDGVYLIDPVPIKLTELDISIVSTDQFIQEISLDEVLINTYQVKKVKAHEYKDNRIIIGNLTEKSRNYAAFQRYASAIKVEWATENKTYYLDDSLSNSYLSKKDEYYAEASFLRDEVYSLGIVFVFNDGTYSPVFHIPGRPPLNNTGNVYGSNSKITTSLNLWDTLNIPSDSEVVNPNQTKRWQVYNTFTSYTAANNHGLLGYYESETTYPQIPNCDDHPDGYFGRDWLGNLIVPGVTKLRHHRMPEILNDFRPLYLKFTINSYYPDEDIMAHFFVVADRTGNKTIMDKGIVVPISSTGGNGSLFAPTATMPDGFSMPSPAGLGRVFGYVSPATVLRTKTLNADHFKVERIWNIADSNPNSIFSGFGTEVAPTNVKYDVDIKVKASQKVFGEWTLPIKDTTLAIPFKWQYNIDGISFVGPESVVTAGKDIPMSVTNASTSTSKYCITTKDQVYFASPSVSIPFVHVNPVYTLAYKANESNNRIGAVSISLKSTNSVYNDLFSLRYKRIGNRQFSVTTDDPVVIDAKGGDTFITHFPIIDTGWEVYEVNPSAPLKADIYAYVNVFAIESDFNIGLSHSYLPPYKMIQGNAVMDNLYAYFKTLYRSSGKRAVGAFDPVYYDLNASYNFIYGDEVFFPRRIENCKLCEDKFPNRVYYSEIDNTEEKLDTNRIIKPNNYADLPLDNGQINVLTYVNNRLYAICDLGTYYIPTGELTLSTDETNLLIGTGTFLSRGALSLKDGTIPFGGIYNFRHGIKTPFGYYFVDTKSNKVFSLSSKLTDISVKGLRSFFERNGRLILEENFKALTGQQYPHTTTIHPHGIGFTVGYDPQHLRLIISKRDFKLKVDRLEILDPESYYEGFWFDGTHFRYFDSIVSLFDPRFFENRSFTISYSFISDSWASFHTYFPYFLISDFDTFYSDRLLRHNQPIFTGPHYIEVRLPISRLGHGTLSSVVYSAHPKVFSTSTGNSVNEVTFNKVMAYTDEHLSPQLPLIYRLTPFTETLLQANLRKADGKYQINDIRALNTNNGPLFLEHANTIASNWQHQYPNTSIINTSISPYQARRLKGEYIGVRLTQDNLNVPNRLLTDLIGVYYYENQR